MGWNTVDAPAGSVLFDGLADERFYFVHSYGVRDFPLAPTGAGPAEPAAGHLGRARRPVRRRGRERPLSATQFHPEKSGDAGAQLLTNWLDRSTDPRRAAGVAARHLG